MREKVARKWAARAMVALATFTREQGKRWASPDYDPDPTDTMPIEYPSLQGPRVVDPLLTFCEEWKGTAQTQTTVTPSLRTLYPQFADHPSHSRARAQIAPALRAEALALVNDYLVGTWERDQDMALNPDKYVLSFDTARHEQHTEALTLSVEYVRVIGADEETGERTVEWVPNPDLPDVAAQMALKSAPTFVRPLHDLERAANAFLREHGETWSTTDVLNRYTRQREVAPDPFVRGRTATPRFTRPAPCTYGHILRAKDDDGQRTGPYELPAGSRQFAVMGDYMAGSDALESDNVIGRPIGMVTTWTLLPTVTRTSSKRTHKRTDSDGKLQTVMARDGDGRLIVRTVKHRDGTTSEVTTPVRFVTPTSVTKARLFVGCSSPARDWYGTATDSVGRIGAKLTKARAAASASRGESTGTRGPVRTPWQLSERSLPRAWDKADAGQCAFAEHLESILRTLAAEEVVTLSADLTVQTDGATAVLIGEHGPSARMSVRSLARRAALARLAID